MSLRAKMRRKNKLASSKQRQISQTVNPINKLKVSNSNEIKPQYLKYTSCKGIEIGSTITINDNKYKVLEIDRARKCFKVIFEKSGFTLNIAS